MQNVKEFGAVGDGKTVDTKAIQKAIDAGGAVFIPDGVYVTGTLYLKSNGGLVLSPGATLLASHDRNDYNSADFCPQNQVFESEFMAGTHMITAVEQENVFIAGFGTICGDSHWWVNEKNKQDYCDFWGHPSKEAERPAQMVFFAECKNVRVENVNLSDSPFWHLYFHGCTDVSVHAVHIKGERRQWVNDGIDVDCCSNVTISDCIIDTGDDGITLRADGAPLVKKAPVCENIVISNCVITSYLDYGIRLGVGNGIIRNCLFSNITITDSLCGIGATCRFSPEGSCTSIENITFSNVTVEAGLAIGLRVSNLQAQPPLKNPGYLRNIRFNNMDAVTHRYCYVLGFEDTWCSDIEFNHTTLSFVPKPEDERRKCEYLDMGQKDCVLLLHKARDVKFHQFSIHNEYAAADILEDDIQNIRVC